MVKKIDIYKVIFVNIFIIIIELLLDLYMRSLKCSCWNSNPDRRLIRPKLWPIKLHERRHIKIQ